MPATPTELALRQARSFLLEHGNVPVGSINESIARSWQRSVIAGLLPTGRLANAEEASGSNFRHAIAFSRELLAHSIPVMEYLYEQVKNSHSMVILADKRATLMHTIGDLDFQNKADRVALSTGSSWNELHRGTNAIGMALVEASCVEINGAEHFLERNGFLTCAAAPIMAANGELIGLINISGDQRSRHPHTLGLVSMAARMVENRLILSSCKRNILLHLHAHSEGIGSVAEGIVAISDDEWIIGANRIGLAMLHLNPADLSGTPLNRCIDVSLAELLSRHKHRPGAPTQVHSHNGATFFVQVQVPENSLSLKMFSASSANVPADALTSVDTGDTNWHIAADKARHIADKPISLLIHGESGVGKSFFARALHNSSSRRNSPFVVVNCAAVSENVIETELFGCAPGAFSGARREGCIGKLREVHGGTLYLNEIGNMPLSMQARLLHVLQERKVLPVGGGKPIDIDFALVCGSQRNLREETDKGSFLRDLYYRINGLTVNLPALRERSDFQKITELLLSEIMPGHDIYLAPDLLEQLGRYTWPGNVHQYSNVLRAASAMLDVDESQINWKHLPEDLVEELTKIPKIVPLEAVRAVPQNLDDLSRTAIKQAMESCHGNISEAARRLGISRQTLYRKLNT
ncbi:sigma-54-dependent Fis family transcriptional regulator [Rhodoferax sp.]|uniref:sigma-54-dependent Fis family transcriptional regulator n=1 Tax=Rhodoferax sp. TaxID=50421 RepID=UPI00283DA0D1|nr:sigma-54-dependent Fis family transcriptional regulator [Rhodoferax sp.]MDR3370937.1 sigma-54-dependent Fis family transcriptional regulator [Rhodoferax sp.]